VIIVEQEIDGISLILLPVILKDKCHLTFDFKDIDSIFGVQHLKLVAILYFDRESHISPIESIDLVLQIGNAFLVLLTGYITLNTDHLKQSLSEFLILITALLSLMNLDMSL
jgi:hypothetical protein